MSERANSDILNDIREAIQRITVYLDSMSFDVFADDLKTQDAVIRNIEIIGEAAKKIPENLRAANPHIPWKRMAGMRDRLIHHYFGINLDIVWQVITQELPALVPELARIIQEGESKS